MAEVREFRRVGATEAEVDAFVAVFLREYAPVAQAAQAGDVETIQALLARAADANEVDIVGVAALAHAAAGGHLTTIEMLLDAGVDLDAGAPLVHAAQAEQVEAVRLLLARGADPTQRNVEGVHRGGPLPERLGHRGLARRKQRRCLIAADPSAPWRQKLVFLPAAP